MAPVTSIALFLTVGFIVAAEGAAPASGGSRSLLQASAPPPGENGALFDWGRPCTLVGDPSANEITGPGNSQCTSCGSGATATPDPTCTFKPITVPVNSPINIFYHSSVHHLILGKEPCDFGPTSIEVCKNATSEATSKTTPCIYKFTTPGKFTISDKSGAGGTDAGGYCKEFGAHLNVTVTA